VNDSLLNYLNAFHIYQYGFNQINGKDFAFIITNNGSNLSGSTLTFVQEYNCMNYWLSLRKIVITSISLPIQNEYIPAQIGNSAPNTNQTLQLPIITDFIPIIQNAADSKSVAYYNPTSQYRLVNLLGTIPLQKVNLSLYWQDLLGNLYPILISQFQQASLKLAFIRKSMYKNNNLLKMK
jgi:hypothetical protein